jgi:hypothetical protein
VDQVHAVPNQYVSQYIRAHYAILILFVRVGVVKAKTIALLRSASLILVPGVMATLVLRGRAHPVSLEIK